MRNHQLRNYGAWEIRNSFVPLRPQVSPEEKDRGEQWKGFAGEIRHEVRNVAAKQTHIEGAIVAIAAQQKLMQEATTAIAAQQKLMEEKTAARLSHIEETATARLSHIEETFNSNFLNFG